MIEISKKNYKKGCRVCNINNYEENDCYYRERTQYYKCKKYDDKQNDCYFNINQKQIF